jgi:multidrug resistance efflux pump
VATSGCGSASGQAASTPAGEARVVRRAVEDVFLLTGELAAVRSASLAAPRGREMQIRWMVEDGSDVKAGERVIEFDASRLIEDIEERRLRARQAEYERENRERTLLAETERKRVAVEKAQVEVDKARIDAEVPRALRAAIDWRRMQATFQEKQAALEKARLEQDAFRTSARADLEVARRAEEKARRDLEAAEKALTSTTLTAPKSGIFLAGNFWQWGPEGPRKLQPGDTVWANFPVASLPDPSEMEVKAVLSEVDHGKVGAGMKARCVLDTYPDRVFEGRIENVGAVAAEATFSFTGQGGATGFPVRISLARTDPVMRPGLSVRVEVVRGSWPEALVVPRQAVRFEKGVPVVRRSRRGAAAGVRLGACTPVECVLESGLREGEVVHVP